MKVLIIDDDKFIRTVYESQLQQENIDVELAPDGESGLVKAKSAKPDLILLDMILPQKDGFEILKELKANSNLKNIPVVVFSSLSQQNDIDEAFKLGAIKYLPKDTYSPAQIVEEIKNILLK
ncbi:response regulator [Candidatus Wolfebacteria bacterium]|nr:response regulator [Candidatus Wolfebacteria bacterium]